jgi:hypothetical protein
LAGGAQASCENFRDVLGEEHRVGQRQVHGGRLLVFVDSRALLRFMDGR